MMLDAVMKSGGNQFHGDAIYYGSAGKLEGSNLTSSLETQGVRNVPRLHELWDTSGTLGGRIVQNKLWFFGAARSTGFNREILDAFYTDGTPMENNRRLPYWSAKLSYQANEMNKFSAFYHQAKEFERRGGSRFVPAESRTVYEGPIATWGGTWQAVKGNSFVTTLQSGAFYQKAWYFAEASYDNMRAGKPDDDGRSDDRRTVAASVSLSNQGNSQLLPAEFLRREPSVQGRVRPDQFGVPPEAAQ
jgi:hypothetical protein